MHRRRAPFARATNRIDNFLPALGEPVRICHAANVWNNLEARIPDFGLNCSHAPQERISRAAAALTYREPNLRCSRLAASPSVSYTGRVRGTLDEQMTRNVSSKE